LVSVIYIKPSITSLIDLYIHVVLSLFIVGFLSVLLFKSRIVGKLAMFIHTLVLTCAS